MQYRLGELFCGPGGIAWGATHADIGNSIIQLYINGPMIMMQILAKHTGTISALMHHKQFTMKISVSSI